MHRVKIEEAHLKLVGRVGDPAADLPAREVTKS